MCVVVLERQDKPLDNGNATVLTNCPESWTDLLASSRLFKTIVPELRALVIDNVFWPPANPGNALFEEMAHL